jgi:hypothetical protein
MAAYATEEREFSAPKSEPTLEAPQGRAGPSPAKIDIGRGERRAGGTNAELSLVEQLLDRLADRVAAMLADRLGAGQVQDVEWFDSRRASEYLGVHRDTLRKLAAERAIPPEQEGAGCKLYFRRVDLDVWRRSGGRPRHLASVVANAA